MNILNIYTIGASTPFAEALVNGLIARHGRAPLDLAGTVIYLPTRRAARNFSDTFARVLGGAALLPQFKPLGDVEEDELLFDGGDDFFDLPPAIAPLRRKLLMASLIRRWRRTIGDPINFTQASALADALTSALDELERQDCDLSKFETLVPAPLAAHWENISVFLVWLRDQWPALLAAEGAMSAVQRRNAALETVTARLATNPPDFPVIAAGSTGSIPATARLLRVIAGLPLGAVILPGLDRDLDEDSWATLDESHPQFGLRQLLAGLGADRNTVLNWDGPSTLPAREKLLSETLRPPPTTHAWRAIAEAGGEDIAHGLDNLSMLETSDSADEARVIALALRETLETPGRTAALVTPDRSLARRVAAEMQRWNVDIDNSAGRPLAHTAVGAFLCLLAEAAEAEFAPVPLLSLLKHPLAAPARTAGAFRAMVRSLDLALRGARPDSGLSGISRCVAHHKDKHLATWWSDVSDILNPLEQAIANEQLDIIVKSQIDVAEALAGADNVWRGDDGQAAAILVDALRTAADGLPPIEPGGYAALFRSLAEEKAVRPAFGKHPRLSILGTQEARLQSFDRVILSGLNEGTWPQAAGTDPWFSRPMRREIGLEQPERAIGLAAHDFSMLAAGPEVLLTRALKTDGAPTVMSRWLQRLTQLTRGLELEHRLRPPQNFSEIAQALITPVAEPRMKRPAPRPPVSARPRMLSVTEIETWLRDPYAVYAKRVLGLRVLDPLDYQTGPLERGTAVHQALEIFIARYPGELPADAEEQLLNITDSVFRSMDIPGGIIALWRPRVANAAKWFVALERERRSNILKSHLEVRGERKFGDFTLYGVADRIDELKDGSAALVDYKTGAMPSRPQVTELLSPQLPLEGAILTEGGFKNVPPLSPSELLYIRFSGGAVPGETRDIPDAAGLSQKAAERLAQRIAFFGDESTPYHSRLRPYRSDIAGDYDHLARVREWSLTGWSEGDE